MNAYFCVCIAALLAYAAGILHVGVLSRVPRTRLVQFVYAFTIVALYLYCVSRIYGGVGLDDWNFRNALPTANVSPFSFFCCLFFPFLPRASRRVLGGTFALLSFGMLTAAVLTGVYNILRNYTLHDTYVCDIAAHLVLSLFGVYLVQSGQVRLRVRDLVPGGLYIVVIALAMLVLNAVFGTAYFGLSFAGRHNIYGVVLPNAYLSAAVYLTGLVGVLCVGGFFQRFLCRHVFARQKRGASAPLLIESSLV